MWVEELKKIDAAAVQVLVALDDFRQRMGAQALLPSDDALVLLWSRNAGAAQVPLAVEEASAYLASQRDQMLANFRKIDMFHLMISVYAVGDFEIYLREVHNVGPTPLVADHPVIRALVRLSAQKAKIAEMYSEDYDASDAAIAAELEKTNPWA